MFQIKKEKETTNNTNTHSKSEILSPVISDPSSFLKKKKGKETLVAFLNQKKNQKETKKQMQILTSKPKSRAQVRP